MRMSGFTPARSLVLLVFLLACSTESAPAREACAEASLASDTVNVLSGAECAAGWQLLFDGKTTGGWRGYKSTGIPAGWSVADAALTRTGAGGDIVTADQFANFELSLQWRIGPAGNSGILYRVTEAPDQTYQSGPEMQVLDYRTPRHPDGKFRLTAAGAAYGIYPAPAGIVRPADEWNAARLVVNGSHVEHWLNGAKIVEYELGSPDWVTRVKASKFNEWPTYGRATSGHIALQDHGDRVSFRSIKIRVIE
jgi:hypothetical protein